jgi:hypothetical protein
MGFLDKVFGRSTGAGNADGLAVEAGVSSLTALYDDPEVKSERGISLTGPRASEVRVIGKRLHKSGGKANMLSARDALRTNHGWAVANLEAIWASMPEWRN